MRISDPFDLPEPRQRDADKARRLEWMTLVYLSLVAVSMYLVMGSSQAMKTAWVEDMLSLIPPAAFLVADRIRRWPPDRQFPYGYHRAVTISFLLAAFALLAMGGYLAVDAVAKIITAEHPTIGGVRIAGRTVWLGWLMLPVLIWSVVPAFFIGRAKLPLARRLHDKCLHADADMNKADWLTGAAAMVGVIGISLGLWWADPAAALFISVAIIKDGWTNTREVVGDLMDRRPQTVDHQPLDELPEQIRTRILQFEWAASAEIRLREHGHVLFGEVFVVPQTTIPAASLLAEAQDALRNLDWRLHELLIVFVTPDELELAPDKIEPAAQADA